MRKNLLAIIIFTIILLPVNGLDAQVNPLCDSIVPNFVVDLTGNDDSTYFSPSVSRAGLCCSNSFPDRCISFIITLDSNAVGIIFDVYSGAQPPGALFYRIGCDTIEYPVGSLACLSGPGPHHLTFCKPGANQNVYSITSVAGRLIPDTAQTVEGCNITVGVDGLVDSTIVWTDVTPGAGGYDSLLSCSVGCDTVEFSSIDGLPSLIKYYVCGEIQTPHCEVDSSSCDTVYVQVIPNLNVQIVADPPQYCAYDTMRYLHASTSTWDSTYTFEWFQGSPDTGTLVSTDSIYNVLTPGWYSLVVTDSLYPICSNDTAEIFIEFYPPPVLNIPSDETVCANTQLSLNASGGDILTWYTDMDTLCYDCDSILYLALNDEIIYVSAEDTFSCVSVDSFLISVLPTSLFEISDTICSNEMYTLPNGTTTNLTGTYADTLTGVNGCDSILTVILTVNTAYNEIVNEAICSNESYTLPNGSSTNTSGTYIDTFQTVNGCDSIITTNLTVYPISETTQSVTICANESYTLPSGSTTNTAGTYVDTFQTVNGCDSIITTNLQVNPVYATNLLDTICSNETYTLANGSTVNTSGIYTDSLTTVNGCDSIITVSLTVNSSYSAVVNEAICANETYTLPNGSTINTAGTYMDTFQTVNGCDSVIITNLTVYPIVEITEAASICANESYTLPSGSTTNTAGTYVDTFQTINGCDSIITTNLQVNPVYTTNLAATICSNETYTLPNGGIVNATGIYNDTLATINGCDSIVIVDLSVNTAYSEVVNETICSNESYTLPNGSSTNTSGTYIDTFQTVNGCDSVITTNLTVYPIGETTQSAAICANESYTLPSGSTTNTAGTYVDTFQTVNGCDSIITTNLQVNPVYATNLLDTICSNETYTLANGSTVNTSGIYTDSLTTVNGCDSIITVSLTVNSSYSAVVNEAICANETYTLPNGSTINTAGTYMDTFQTVNGCDSVITTNLTVYPIVEITEAASICANESYTLPSGSTTNTAGTYVDTFQTVNGCDSIITTNLQVNPVYATNLLDTICSNETYTLANGSTVNTSGTYTDSLTTVNGCDSIITVSLTVNSSYSAVVNEAICANETYTLPNGSTINTAGTYMDTFQTVNGCDSVITTNLTVYPIVEITEAASICANESYTLPSGSTTNTAGTYVDTFQTVNGCDSIITTNLQVNPVYATNLLDTICSNETYTLANGSTVNTSGIYTDSLTTVNGCDSIITVSLTVNSSYSAVVNEAICANETYTLPNGSTINTAGTYMDTFQTVNGCDSVITTNLTVYPIVEITEAASICANESYTLPSGSTTNTAGTYVDTFQTVNGCDSIITTNLQVNPVYATNLLDTICSNETYTLANGSTVNTSGTYTDSLTTVNGCDSIITVSLTVNSSYSAVVNEAICANETYTLPNGSTINTAGTYMDTFQTVNGCDSVITTNLTVYPIVEITEAASICANESYTLPSGSTTNTAGTYVDTFQTVNGCDSIITTNLQVNPVYATNLLDTICSNETYTLANGSTVNTSGTYTDSLTTVNGCDSIITVSLTVNSSYSAVVNEAICANETYTLPNGSTINTAGTYMDTFQTVNGCDSVITTNLTVYPIVEITEAASICANESYTLPSGSTTNTAGTYVDTFQTVNGCDSIITTNLQVNPVYATNLLDTICSNETYTLANGSTVNTSGTYTDSLTTVNGCDSIITVSLTVNPSYSAVVNEAICANETYTLPNGSTINTAGTYMDTFQTVNGCDSVITTNLTVYPIVEITEAASICANESYTLPSGSTTNTAGTYVDTFQTVNGCDSIITTNLQVNPVYATNLLDTICSNETYTLANGSTVNTSGTYTDSLTTVNGCDSIITVSLTVNSSYSAVVNEAICANETYTLPNGSTINTAGTYMDTFQTVNGCDSVITTNLTVYPIVEITEAASICANESYTLPSGSTTNTAGTYVDTFQTVNGCDSIITTNLQVNPVYATNLLDTICSNETYTLPNGDITSTAGAYTYTLTTTNGCDSIVSLSLTVQSAILINERFDICAGEVLVLPTGDIVSSDTVILYSYVSNHGCDSTHQYTVIVHESYSESRYEVICEGQSIWIGDHEYTISGIYIDTLRSIWGCDSIVELNLNVLPSSSSTIDTSICRGDGLQIGSDFFNQSGSYVVNLFNHAGCDSTIYIDLDMVELPEVVSREDTTIYQGATVTAYTLTQSSANLNFTWFINDNHYCSFCEFFDFQYFQNSIISVEVVDSNNCKSRDEFNIIMNDDCPEDLITVPNIITPNGDGYNDFFKIANNAEVDIELIRIFNRWGELVYEAQNFNTPWDGSFRGEACNPGVFTYYLIGTCSSSSSFTKKGNITLLK